MTVQFRKENGIGKALFDWWKGLEDDRASRAILRRASSVTAVALTPPYQRLFRRLCAVGWKDEWTPGNDALAAIVGLLSHVEQNDERSVARSMSQRDEVGDRPPVSELRFLRLLDSPDLDTLFTGLRRVLPLMNHSVDVLALANDILCWSDPAERDAIKKKWAYDYVWPEKSMA